MPYVTTPYKRLKDKILEFYGRLWGNTIGRFLGYWHDCYVAYEWSGFPDISKMRCRKCGKYFGGSRCINYKKLVKWKPDREEILTRYFGQPTRTPEEYKTLLALGEIKE